MRFPTNDKAPPMDRYDRFDREVLQGRSLSQWRADDVAEHRREESAYRRDLRERGLCLCCEGPVANCETARAASQLREDWHAAGEPRGEDLVRWMAERSGDSSAINHRRTGASTGANATPSPRIPVEAA